MNILKKVLTYLVFPIVIVVMVWGIVHSIMVPVNFEKDCLKVDAQAITRLKAIRTLEVAFNSVYGHYTASMDSLINFYNNGNMTVVMQIGSNDDSLAVENTMRLKKKFRNISPEKLYELYKKGENLVFSMNHEIPVKDTLFKGVTNFNVDSLRYIPGSNKDTVKMKAVVKLVSGVHVPLFEAKMPYWSLYHNLSKINGYRQLIVNKVDELKEEDLFPGLMVGSVTAPNNNAGNWE